MQGWDIFCIAAETAGGSLSRLALCNTFAQSLAIAFGENHLIRWEAEVLAGALPQHRPGAVPDLLEGRRHDRAIG
jgi:hypothetical protein